MPFAPLAVLLFAGAALANTCTDPEAYSVVNAVTLSSLAATRGVQLDKDALTTCNAATFGHVGYENGGLYLCGSGVWVPLESSRCGDGVVEGNEACDDGNTENGDECSATCAVATVPTVLSSTHIVPGQGNTPSPAAGTTFWGLWAAEVGDLDGDGRVEMAMSSQATADIDILYFNADGTTAASHRLTLTTIGSVAHELVVQPMGDWDGDGVQDLVVCNVNGNKVAIILLSPGTTPGDRTPVIKDELLVSTGFVGHLHGMEDIDGNGRRDLIMANSGQNDVRVMLLDDPVGQSVGVITTLNISPVSLGFQAGDLTGYGPFPVGDFDGNGTPDFAVGSIRAGPDNKGALIVFLLDWSDPTLALAAGTSNVVYTLADVFSGTTLADPLFGYRGMSIGDVDSNGQMDLVTTSSDLVAVLLIDTDMSLLKAYTFDGDDFVGNFGRSFANLGDLNGDNKGPDMFIGFGASGATDGDGNVAFFDFFQCGNNVVDQFEACDDGNLADDDGCDAQCDVEIV